MSLQARQSYSRKRWLGSDEDEVSMAVLNALRHCYVRESQHAMRYRQHAERARNAEFRRELLRIAAEEQKHAQSLAAEIENIRGALPDVIPIHVAKEQNLWSYLRTDLEEEERCAAEVKDDLLMIRGKSPHIAALLKHIDADCESHWVRVRAMLAESDPLSPGPA